MSAADKHDDAHDRGADAPIVALYPEIETGLRRGARSARLDEDDFAQDAVERALRAGRSVRLDDPIRWIARIARNLRIDRQRRRKFEERVFVPLETALEQRDEAIDQERALAAKERLTLAMAVIDGLPARCREAFVAYRFHDRSQAEIARDMGISVSAVEKHIAQAMKKLLAATRET